MIVENIKTREIYEISQREYDLMESSLKRKFKIVDSGATVKSLLGDDVTLIKKQKKIVK
jgi:hypothetical protein